MSRVTVIDYGMGNLLSVQRALLQVGAEVIQSSDPARIAEASHLILPGVGAFGDGMQELQQRELIEPIRERAAAGIPLLGICLGAQMLLDDSEEFGNHPGLGIIAGGVRPIPARGSDGQPVKVPHMGWADLLPADSQAFGNALLRGVAPGEAMYFVHSFQMQPADAAHLVALANNAGNLLTAMVALDNVFGCQFHPEKSGPAGLRILQNFVGL